MARPKKQINEPQEPKQNAEVSPKSKNLILTQSEHAKLSNKEKEEFRAKNGTVSNQ